MDTIETYIENIFQNYPSTIEIKKAKEDLLNLMEDKYNELKQDGKTENEAIGIVISEFGNIDEITTELGMSQSGSINYDTRPSYKMDISEAKSYLNRQDIYGKKISVGVVLCILSPVTSGIMEILSDNGILPSNIAETIGIAALFLLVIVAVGIFIVSGIAHNKDEEIEKKQILLDYNTRSYMEELYEKYHKKHAVYLTIGVILCITSIIPGGISSTLFQDNANIWISDLMSYSLFFIVSAGVFFIITSCTYFGALELLLGKGDHSPEKAKKAEDKILSIISAIYWPVTIAIYLGWSFLTNDWGISWIVWPIAGILFGGISAVCGLMKTNH